MPRCLLILLLLVILVVPPNPVRAQEATPEPTATLTPTPTPTPAYIQEQPLSSGNVLRVERTITYGDAAITIMLLVSWITYILANAVKVPRSFTQR